MVPDPGTWAGSPQAGAGWGLRKPSATSVNAMFPDPPGRSGTFSDLATPLTLQHPAAFTAPNPGRARTHSLEALSTGKDLTPHVRTTDQQARCRLQAPAWPRPDYRRKRLRIAARSPGRAARGRRAFSDRQGIHRHGQGQGPRGGGVVVREPRTDDRQDPAR